MPVRPKTPAATTWGLRWLVHSLVALMILTSCRALSKNHSAADRGAPTPGATPGKTDQARTRPPEDPFKGWSRERWEAWLKPPPADRPQPRFVCKGDLVDGGEFWRGQLARFIWEVSNEGAGPLSLRIYD